MAGKVTKNVTASSAKLFNVNNTAVKKSDGHNSEISKILDNKMVKSKKQEKPFSPKSSLDKVAEDIEHILGDLNVFSADNLISLEPIELKILQKEFFKKGNVIERRHSVSQKSSNSSTRAKSLSMSKLFSNSMKITVNRKKSGTVSRTGSCTITRSNHNVRKVPLTKSELQNFKHNIIMRSNQVFKHPERIKYQDKQKIARNVKTLIQAALKESEHNRKPPVIDVGSFIQQSMVLAIPKISPEPKKIIENKSRNLSSGTDSGSDWSVKLNTVVKKEVHEEGSKLERHKGEIFNIEKKNVPSDKINKTNSSNHPPQTQSDNGRGPQKCENVSNKNISNHLVNPIVQTFKTVPNNGYTSRDPPKTQTQNQGQSKATGNQIIQKNKLPPSKSIVNVNSTQKNMRQICSKTSTNKQGVSPTKLVTPKIKSAKSQVMETNRKAVNQTKSQTPTRSNSTLGTVNIPATARMSVKNVTSIVATRPSTARSTSTTASKLSGMTRNRSLHEERRSRIYPSPERTTSAMSSKSSRLVNTRSYYSRNLSTHSSCGTCRSASHLNNPIKQLRDEVNRAIRDGKTFTVRGTHTAIRKALLRRGWVERFHIANSEKLEHQMNWLRHRSLNELEDMIHVRDLNDICKKLIKSKLLANHQVDLYWGTNYDSFIVNPDRVKLTKINKFKRDVFSYTSKQGLCDAAKNAHWFNFPGLANIKHPRTYALSRNGETKDFIKTCYEESEVKGDKIIPPSEDFRRTAAMSLLKWIIKSHDTKDCKIVSSSGKVPLEAFQFAANECCKIVIEANNEDIDQPLKEASDHEWNQFLEYYYKILHIGNHFKSSNLESETTIVIKSAYLIKKLTPHYPHIKMDGTMNIWILKPAVGSQGRGIHICRTLQYILRTVKNNNTIRYIAQKYIERPLLIFNTKFDIRQWFLISSAMPLTIWMYKECYLRFSSQTYNLRKLHESIHLTNNSVQQRYQSTSHDITLPNYNMWDSHQFKTYLSNIGFPDVYKKVIYKGMKECIIGAVMIHQDKIDKRHNSFELYGADFMLTEDFKPWLIEINSSPALYASTPVTSRMCPQVLEDTIKVVVDHASNPRARTGNFELIYRQKNLLDRSQVNIKNFKVSGKPLPRSYFCSDDQNKDNGTARICDNSQSDNDSSETGSEIAARSMKETLESLLKFIHNEKKKRKKKKLVAKGTDPIKLSENRVKGMRSSSTCTNRSMSLVSLKSQWDQLAGNEQIAMDKEDLSMIDEALKILKENKHGEIIGFILEIIEKILNEAERNKIEV